MPRRVPSYRRHCSGQARVTIRSRDIMLGPFDSPESHEKYGKVIAEYLASQTPRTFAKPVDIVLIGELVADYLIYAQAYFGDAKEGKNVKRAVKPVAALYAELPVEEFGALQFKAVREQWLLDGTRARGYVNGQMARVLRFLKWAVSEGKMPSSVVESCRCVSSLKRGKCQATESEPIMPVELKLVDATLPHLTRVVGDMVRFQLATGCRPGEVVQITPAMVDRTDEVWTISIREHKTAWRGREKCIYVGPKAQEVLRPYLLRGSDEPCFSPIESERQRLSEKHAARVTPLSCGNRPGWKVTRRPKNPPGRAFTTGSYANSIRHACKREKLDHWSPNQLRHTAATLIRKQFGLEAAQVILGHSKLSVTQVYAERDRQKAIDIAKKIG